MIFKEYADSVALMQSLAGEVAQALCQRLITADRATLAVPGGSTPGPMFDILSTLDVDWARVDVLLTDERWVPEDSPRSNTCLLRMRLLQNRAAKAKMLPFYQTGLNAKEGAATVAGDVAALAPIGVLILGMGTDMHCASLFPGAPELSDAQSLDSPAVWPMTPQDGLEPRITLTAPILLSALSTHILILGDDKRAAIESAMTLEKEAAPIRQFLDHAVVHWATR